MGDSSDDSLFVRLEQAPLAELIGAAGRLRDEGHGRHISYSRKVFIPLTHLCRDVCHYCTFAQRPRAGRSAYLSPDDVLAIARAGAAAGCTEALFTLGDKPELRWRVARDELAGLGYETTIDYLQAMCALALRETGLLPHANPGIMSRSEMAGLRTVSASQGIMLESLSVRLCEPGGVHYGSPDKRPEVRLETLRLAGELRVPFTTGILIGIGETRAERLEALFAIRDLHRSFGHVQEVIVQNFRAKPGTKLAGAAEPDLDDLLWSLAAARLILGPTMNIQAPPNLSPGVYPRLIAAGINDWAGSRPSPRITSIRRRHGRRSPRSPSALPPPASCSCTDCPSIPRTRAPSRPGRRQRSPAKCSARATPMAWLVTTIGRLARWWFRGCRRSTRARPIRLWTKSSNVL